MQSMDWTLEDNKVADLFFCVTLTGRRGGHTPFLQAGEETSDTGVEVVKPDPRCSFQGHSRMVSAGVGDENAEPRSVVRPLRIPLVILPLRRTMLLLSDELMSCCAAGTNECLDLRRCAFALDGRVSAEWSRCPDSSTTCWR